MNDRERLELAAKAAGIELDWDIPPNSKSPWRMTGTKGCDDYGPASEWNPLTNDGDALRLVVKLDLRVRSCCARLPNGVLFTEDDEYDDYAATRRAIVRAAAEIGRNMK